MAGRAPENPTGALFSSKNLFPIFFLDFLYSYRLARNEDSGHVLLKAKRLSMFILVNFLRLKEISIPEPSFLMDSTKTDRSWSNTRCAGTAWLFSRLF